MQYVLQYGSAILQYAFYTPDEDGMYYRITLASRQGGGCRPGGRASPILCPEHISKTILAKVMKLLGWIDLMKAECNTQES